MIQPPHEKQLPWWAVFPRGQSLTMRDPGPRDVPQLAVGTVVRLRGKPERLRKIMAVEWHRFRWVYAYVVETSADESRRGFKPYWFYPQLEVVETRPDL